MKILQIGGYSFFEYRGGIERIIHSLSMELSMRDHKVTLIAATKKNERIIKINKNLSIIFLKPLELLNTPINLSLIKYISKQDLIHLHFPNPGNVFLGGLFANFLQKPYIFTYHTPIISYNLVKFLYNSIILRYLLKHAASITVPAPHCLNYFPMISSFPSKIRIIPNFIDTSKFYLRNNAKTALSKFIDFNNSQIITHVSTLDKAHQKFKGTPVLFSALKKLEDIDKKNEYKLVIIGAGEFKAKYEEISKKLGIDKKVIFLGRVSDTVLSNIYSASDCFVLPSLKTESFGLVLAEAMACQCPVIGSNVGGIPFVIGKSGILVRPNDPTELAKKISFLIENQELHKKYAKNGLKRVISKFSLNRIVDIYEKLFLNTINQ